MDNIKREASVAGGIKGFNGPGGTDYAKDKKITDSKEPESFENSIIASELFDKDFKETVRKRGNQWVIYDDDTDVAKGTYSNRDSAWEKQRVLRRSKKSKQNYAASEKERKKREVPGVDKPYKAEQPKATEPKKEPKPHGEKIKKKKTVRSLESLNSLLNFINENSMVSYVFENNPMSEESLTWDNFINKLSKQAVMSDPKLNKILHGIAKVELNCLKKSVGLIKDTLEGSGRFVVQSGNKIDRDMATNDPKLDFFISMKDNKKKLKFAIKLDSNRPLIMWEDSKDMLDQMGNEESKLLRAELIHIQETSFKKMDDIVAAIEKRDKYLKGVEQKFDKVLNIINPLEMNMLKYLLRDKYKSIR